MNTRTRSYSAWIFTTLVTAFSFSEIASAEVVLATDFTGRTVAAKTASNISWTVSGVQDPGDLTWMLEGGGPAGTALFDTANAQGHFAPDLNIGNEGPWSVTIPLTVIAAEVILQEVVLDWQHFNNTGIFQGVSRSADWTVSVTGSASGLVGSVTANAVAGSSGVETLSFTPALALGSVETYEVKILVAGSNPTGNNTGLDGVTLEGVVNSNPDFTAPIIMSLNPTDDAVDVSPLSNLVITFDEGVRKGTGNIVLRQSSDDAIVETIDVNSASVTIAGAEVTVDPAANLAGLSGFYLQIDPGAIEDLAGNDFAGIADASAWSFTTGPEDVTAPIVIGLSPATGATEVALDVELVVTFDEEIRKGTGNIVIRQFNNDSVVESIDVASGNVLLANGELTIRPGLALSGETRYYVEIDPGTVEDPSGNPFAGLTDKAAWSFTTEAGPSIILATGFAGRTVNAKTASGFVWLANGVQEPGDLSWVLEGGGPANTGLFDTPAAQNHFAPDLNIDNEGPWSATINLELTASEILLEEVAIEWQHFNNSGAFQSANRAADWTVSVTGSISGQLASVTAPGVNGISGLETLTFPSPVPLGRSETYELKIFVVGTGPGNNTGLNSITLLGPIGSSAPFRLAVDRDGSDLVLEWDSQAGMLYNLRSSIDLSAELSTWDLLEADVPATPPSNTKIIGLPADSKRFYRIEEFPAPPIVVFADDFDGADQGWTTGFDAVDTEMNTAWGLGDPGGGPITGPVTANSGTNCYGTNLIANYGLNSDTWLRSPSIDLTTATAATLIFQQWVDMDEFDNLDRGTVRVLSAGTFLELGVVETNITGLDPTNWAAFSSNLPAAALGQSIVLEFGFVSDGDDFADASGWYVDDVLVTTPAP